jgi:hypothetical protein
MVCQVVLVIEVLVVNHVDHSNKFRFVHLILDVIDVIKIDKHNLIREKQKENIKRRKYSVIQPVFG